MELYLIACFFYARSPVFESGRAFILEHDSINASLEVPVGVRCQAFLQRFRCVTSLATPLEFRLHRGAIVEFVALEPVDGYVLQFPQVRYAQRVTNGSRCDADTKNQFRQLIAQQKRQQLSAQIAKLAQLLQVDSTTLEAQSSAIRDLVLNLVSLAFELSCTKQAHAQNGAISYSHAPAKQVQHIFKHIPDLQAEQLALQIMESYKEPRWGMQTRFRGVRAFVKSSSGVNLQKMYHDVQFRYFDQEASTDALQSALVGAAALAIAFAAIVLTLLCVARRKAWASES